MSWHKVCKQRAKRGLGIQNLSILNKALLGKSSWGIMSKGEPFWKKVIIGKYGVEEGGWWSLEVREGYGVGLWKAIRKGWDAFKSKISYDLGNGKRVRFWKDIRCEDIWCGDTRLSTSFPSLFTIVTSKEAWVCDVWEHTNFGGCWNPCFVKNFQDWELDCVEALLLRLHSKSMSREVDDKVV